MYEFLVALLRPFPLLFLILAGVIVNLWRRRRETRGRLVLLTLPYVGLALVSTPAVAHLALGTLEWQYPPLGGRPPDARGIIVLAAGLHPPDNIRARAEMDEDTVARCLYAAELYHKGPACPVVVSGGKVDPETPGPACAAVMADFLRQLGVPAADLIVEDASRTTFENAVECGKLLRARRIDKALLVADAVDLFRAEKCFHKQGVAVIPAGCHYRATEFHPSVGAFVPSPGAARSCQRVWHEWLGTAWYWLKGRL